MRPAINSKQRVCWSAKIEVVVVGCYRKVCHDGAERFW